jgi:hypothetical protein
MPRLHEEQETDTYGDTSRNRAANPSERTRSNQADQDRSRSRGRSRPDDDDGGGSVWRVCRAWRDDGARDPLLTMTPFEDELRLEVALVAPPTVGFYTIFAQWWGGRSYFFQGAGDGQVNHTGQRASVSFLFHNHTELGTGKGVGRFAASLHLSTRKGPWSLSILGDGSGTPYAIQGFLVPKPCSQLGSVPPGEPPNLALAPAE